MNAKALFQVWKAATALAVLGAAGQTAAPQTPACTDFMPSVTARVSTAGNSARVDPDQACVAPGGQMNWTAADGETWSVDFADDQHSPFSNGLSHQAGKVREARGARVRACSSNASNFAAAAGGCVFKYKAAHVKGGKTSTIDPTVVVKPGT
jgi:plastocyanin